MPYKCWPQNMRNKKSKSTKQIKMGRSTHGLEPSGAKASPPKSKTGRDRDRGVPVSEIQMGNKHFGVHHDTDQGAARNDNESMRGRTGRDRNSDLDDDDKKAVAWLRSRSLERTSPSIDESEATPATPATRNGIMDDCFEDRDEDGFFPVGSFEKQAERMQERNPLVRPYQISREIPLRPKRGDVLQPRSPPRIKKDSQLQSTPSTVASTPSSQSIEIFEAEESVPNKPLHKQHREIAPQYITPAKAKASPGRKKRSSKKRRPRASPSRFVSDSATIVQVGGLMLPEEAADALRSIKSTADAAARSNGAESDDSTHLSHVGSDVDSVTKERYLLACKMLKTTLIQKETALIPVEREYLLSLLAGYEDHGGKSIVSLERVSTIEKAVNRLEKDSLFFPRSLKSTTEATPASSQTSDSCPPTPVSTPDRLLLAHESGSTIAKPTRKIILEEIRNLDSFADSILDEDMPDQNKRGIIMLPPEEENDIKGNESGFKSSTLVRFDGWSSEESRDQFPFKILLGDNIEDINPRILKPSTMEALKGFFPISLAESNFWLKFSMNRDGGFQSMLSKIRASTFTVICIETGHGEVFGSFTATSWRVGSKWTGSGEAFLWRLKNPSIGAQDSSQMEVFPYSGYDDLVQYCTNRTLAVGGGDWGDVPCPFDGEPGGIGFMVDGDLQGGETNSCATFANPRLSKRTSGVFSISNLEVWAMTPCSTVEDANNLEARQLFVGENANAIC